MDTLQAQLETLKQLAEKNLIDKDEYARCKDNILKNWLSNQTSNSSPAPSHLNVLINEKKDKNAAASPEKENTENQKKRSRERYCSKCHHLRRKHVCKGECPSEDVCGVEWLHTKTKRRSYSKKVEKEKKEKKENKTKESNNASKGESFIKDRVAQLMITPEYQKLGKLAAFTKASEEWSKVCKELRELSQITTQQPTNSLAIIPFSPFSPPSPISNASEFDETDSDENVEIID